MIWKNFKEKTNLQYGHLLHATVRVGGGTRYYYNDDLVGGGDQTLLFDILERESLVKRSIIPLVSQFDGFDTGSVSYFDLSYLAIDLIRVCTRGFTNPIGDALHSA